MSFVGLLIGVVVCGVFAAVVFVLAKKGNAKFQEILATIPEDVKQALVDSPITNANTKKGGVIQTGYLHAIEGEGKKVGLYIVYFNRYFPNQMNEFSYAELSAKSSDLQAHGIKVGDFIKMNLHPEGGDVYFE